MRIEALFEDAPVSALFMAPTGWGKTTLLLEFAKNCEKTLVYLSPLRALADEFAQRASEYGLHISCPSSQKQLRNALLGGEKFELFVVTVELIDDESVILLLNNALVIFDEFHLFYYWGQSFRPKLLDFFYLVHHTQTPALLLSATVCEEIRNFWYDWAKVSYPQAFEINLGNQRIKRLPKTTYYCPRTDWMLDAFKAATPHMTLVFCAYRGQAKSLARKFRDHGFSALSCISGEIKQFQYKLAHYPTPEFIFCTSTLSHGVNLPEISRVCILYEVQEYDLWLQMVGRAGRRGEDFALYCRSPRHLSPKQAMISLLRFLCHYVIKKSWWREIRRAYYS